jgi:hypothetical protein
MGMKKQLLCLLAFVVLVSVLLSGCQDTNSVKTQQLPENVYLDSNIVEFANVSFEQDTNKSGGVESVTVGWLFHNIAGRMISGRIDVRFYDKNNVLVYNDTKYFNNLPADFTERLFQEANKVMYGGDNAGLIDHVVLVVTER